MFMPFSSLFLNFAADYLLYTIQIVLSKSFLKKVSLTESFLPE